MDYLFTGFDAGVGEGARQRPGLILFAEYGNIHIAFGVEAEIVQQRVEASGSGFQIGVKPFVVDEQTQGAVGAVDPPDGARDRSASL